jgi:MHS family proline/betaine transporter-like MFS transporter
VSGTAAPQVLNRLDADLPAVRRRAIVACIVGNLLELYDFSIYGLFALALGRAFFPATDPTMSLLSSFATYGVGFLMRPVGAVVIGAYGDKHGRKAALVVTIALMAAATGLTGCIPSYATIGIGAPILLVLCRLLQGFSTGGEWGGAVAFLVEYAPPGKRGITGSWALVSVRLGLFLASGVAAVLAYALSDAQFYAWGWRLPFMIGFILGPIGFYLRTRVAETPAFARTATAKRLEHSPLRAALTTHRLAVLAAFAISIVGTVGNYVYFILMPNFATQQLKIPTNQTLLSTTLANVVVIVLIPLVGAASDRYGRKVMMMLSSWGTVVAAYPLFLLVTSTRSFTGLLITQCIAAVLMALYSGVIAPILSEFFPTNVRYTALSIGYGFAVTIFGGFAPLIATWLVHATGDVTSPAWFVMLGGLLSGIAMLLMRDRTNAPLD